MRPVSHEIIEILRKEIAKHDKPENKLNYQRFFKETLDNPIAIKTAVLRKISNQCFRRAKQMSGKDILVCCDDLLASGERYMRFFAFEWALKAERQYRAQDLTRFESWLKRYVDNWGACDHLCCGALGHLIYQFPDVVVKTHQWTRSRNRWIRRGAAVSLIVSIRNGLLLKEALRTADVLLVDQDDMVQKGYGWMLKEASTVFPDEVFKFVIKNKCRMPRTALRYAIEKLPAGKRKQAMKKDH